MELSGRTRLAGIFGDPVEHSLSPAMHNAAYAALGVDRAYVAFHVAAEHLAAAVRAIPALGLLGVNLTVPHKERAARMVSELSAEAQILGAVNSIVNRRDRLFGDNTDARGLEIDLRELKVSVGGRPVVIIGAGGGAAAAVLASTRLGARRITIANRTRLRAQRLARRFSKHRFAGRLIEARGLEALADRKTLAEAALVINATPVGLKERDFLPLDYGATPADCLFYDLVYRAEPTAFLKPALERGRRAADGAGMLLYQGVLAFRLLNRVAPPVDAMRRALHQHLGRPVS